MSLPAGQQRVLDRIEDALRAHDSRLAAMFGIFGRLTRHEAMPEVERLRPAGPGGGTGAVGWRASVAAGPVRWVAFVPFAIMVVLSAVIIGLLVTSTTSTQRGCATGAAATAGHKSAQSSASTCKVRQPPFASG
jgi:hypothetical protein